MLRFWFWYYFDRWKIIQKYLIYDISYRTLICAKILCIRFDKIDRLSRVYNGTRYLVLFVPEKYDAICNKITSLISKNSGITYVVSQSYARLKVDSFNFLALEKNINFA